MLIFSKNCIWTIYVVIIVLCCINEIHCQGERQNRGNRQNRRDRQNRRERQNRRGRQNRRDRPQIPSFSDILNDAASLEQAAASFDRAVQDGNQPASTSAATENRRNQVVPVAAGSPFTHSDHGTGLNGNHHLHDNEAPVITDVSGNIPPNPSGFHVDMPGEHGNTHDFPVIHRDSSPISGGSHSHSHTDTNSPAVAGPPFDVPNTGDIGPSLVDIQSLNDDFTGVSVFQTPTESIRDQFRPIDLGRAQQDPSTLFPGSSGSGGPSPSGSDLGLGPVVLGSVPIDPFGNPITTDTPKQADVGVPHVDHSLPTDGDHAHSDTNPVPLGPAPGFGTPVDIRSNTDHHVPDNQHSVTTEVNLLPDAPPIDHPFNVPDTASSDRHNSVPGTPHVDHHGSSIPDHGVPAVLGPAPALPGFGSPVDTSLGNVNNHGGSVPHNPTGVHGGPDAHIPKTPTFGGVNPADHLGPGRIPSPTVGIPTNHFGPGIPPSVNIDIPSFGAPAQPLLPVVPIGVAPGVDNVPVPGIDMERRRRRMERRERRRRWRQERRRRNRMRRLRPAKEPVDVNLDPFNPITEPAGIIPEPHHEPVPLPEIHHEPVPLPEIAHPEPTIDLHRPGRRSEHKHVHPEPGPFLQDRPVHDNHGVTIHREPGHDSGPGYEGRRRGGGGGLLGNILRDAAQIKTGGVLNGPRGARGLFPTEYRGRRNNEVHITRSGPIPTNPSKSSPPRNGNGVSIIVSRPNGNNLTRALGNSIFGILGRMLTGK